MTTPAPSPLAFEPASGLGFEPVTAPATAPSPEHIAAHLTTVSDILTELATEIEDLGARLCTDPAIIANHIRQLQAIDLIAQKQRWLATMLRADCPFAAVDTIGVEALRARFCPAPS